MKAIVQKVYGPPRKVLHLEEVAIPTVGPEDVLVRVRASSANPWDWHFVCGEPILMRPAGIGPRHPMEPLEALGEIDGRLWHCDHDRTRSNTRPRNQKFSTPAHSA